MNIKKVFPRKLANNNILFSHMWKKTMILVVLCIFLLSNVSVAKSDNKILQTASSESAAEMINIQAADEWDIDVKEARYRIRTFILAERFDRIISNAKFIIEDLEDKYNISELVEIVAEMENIREQVDPGKKRGEQLDIVESFIKQINLFKETVHELVPEKYRIWLRKKIQETFGGGPTFDLLSVDATAVDPIQIIATNDAEIFVYTTTKVDADSGAIQASVQEIEINGELITESQNEIVLIKNGEVTTLTNVDKEYCRKLTSQLKPLVAIKTIETPSLAKAQPYVVQVKKVHKLSYKELVISPATSDFDVVVIEASDLTNLLENDDVLKIADAGNLEDFINYIKAELENEAQEKIREMNLKKTVLDVSKPADLKLYMDEDKWDVQPGQTSRYQQFVTPNDQSILELASSISTPNEAYDLAVKWTWVSDQKLHGRAEKWLKPVDFLANTPSYATNPVPGKQVSDCSEQANTLVSLLRANGVAAGDVRVVLGKVKFDGKTGGHAWVEIKEYGKWMVLDSTCGPYYDEESEKSINRNGVGYSYWKYHPYPVEEIWMYYNDVYFTDEKAEVASGWSTQYDVFTNSEMFAGFISEGSIGQIFIYMGVAVIAIISLISLAYVSRKGSDKK